MIHRDRMTIVICQTLKVTTSSAKLRKHAYMKWTTYTGCPRRNVPDFGMVFLVLKYTDITQNTYVQS